MSKGNDLEHPLAIEQLWMRCLQGLDSLTVDGAGGISSIAGAELATVTATIANGGTNAAPSGTFQAASACPVSAATDGKEVAHELLNDGCNAIANHWALCTITA